MSDEFTMHLSGVNSASGFIQSLGESEFCVKKSREAVSLKDPKIGSAGPYDVGIQKIGDASLFVDSIFRSEGLYRVFRKIINDDTCVIINDTDESISLEEMFGLNK